MQLETTITARFVDEDATPEEQANLDAMNVHAEDCAQRLQGPFAKLIIEMMDIKREVFAQPEQAVAVTPVDMEEGTDA